MTDTADATDGNDADSLLPDAVNNDGSDGLMADGLVADGVHVAG